MTNKLGLVQIYTGEGKGKSTASLGLTLRAIGNGLKVTYVFFFKNFKTYPTGEISILEKLGVKYYNFAQDIPLFNATVTPEMVREECLKGIRFIKEMIFESETPDLLIIDEINNAIPGGYLYEREILDLISSKPVNLELVLTGRGTTHAINEAADLVSRIEKVKHPYDKGITRRIGIEY